MTYEQAIAFWYSRINYEQRSARPSDLKLDRMRALLQALGEPDESLRFVHIAGSKGKGSTSAMLAAVLQCAGYRTGLFTSPHLIEVEERIQVDGLPIRREELTVLMEETARVVQEMDRHVPEGQGVTFFEIVTALGFLHFLRRRVEVAVLEVGLGGRFDSTNVCRPLVSIITSISFDHMQQLGYTLASIAREKAGIIKPGRPTVSGVRPAEARAVVAQKCRERGSALCQLDVDFHYDHAPARIGMANEESPRVRVRTREKLWPWMELGLVGDHQAANAAVAVAAVEELRRQGLTIPDDAVAAGLAQVRWPARFEVMSHAPLVILDCAHNLASTEALLDTLKTSCVRESNGRSGQRILIFAGSSDKDLAGMLGLLSTYFTQILLTRFNNNPRCADPEQLATLLPAEACARATVCPTSTGAWERARTRAGDADMICATGSVFLAGELRPQMMRDLARTAEPSIVQARPSAPCL
jgi:dihydrofolate synthase/folylpolyglutamate synthase